MRGRVGGWVWWVPAALLLLGVAPVAMSVTWSRAEGAAAATRYDARYVGRTTVLVGTISGATHHYGMFGRWTQTTYAVQVPPDAPSPGAGTTVELSGDNKVGTKTVEDFPRTMQYLVAWGPPGQYGNPAGIEVVRMKDPADGALAPVTQETLRADRRAQSRARAGFWATAAGPVVASVPLVVLGLRRHRRTAPLRAQERARALAGRARPYPHQPYPPQAPPPQPYPPQAPPPAQPQPYPPQAPPPQPYPPRPYPPHGQPRQAYPPQPAPPQPYPQQGWPPAGPRG